MRPLVEAGKLYRAVTPLYICTKGDKRELFYTEKEYTDWSVENPGWSVLRAKG
jgi:DNA gyrase/topoisomerase IV subunit B